MAAVYLVGFAHPFCNRIVNLGRGVAVVGGLFLLELFEKLLVFLIGFVNLSSRHALLELPRLALDFVLAGFITCLGQFHSPILGNESPFISSLANALFVPSEVSGSGGIVGKCHLPTLLAVEFEVGALDHHQLVTRHLHDAGLDDASLLRRLDDAVASDDVVVLIDQNGAACAVLTQRFLQQAHAVLGVLVEVLIIELELLDVALIFFSSLFCHVVRVIKRGRASRPDNQQFYRFSSAFISTYFTIDEKNTGAGHVQRVLFCAAALTLYQSNIRLQS